MADDYIWSSKHSPEIYKGHCLFQLLWAGMGRRVGVGYSDWDFDKIGVRVAGWDGVVRGVEGGNGAWRWGYVIGRL